MKTLLVLCLLGASAIARAEEHPAPAADAALPQGSLYGLDATWTNQSGKEVVWKDSAGKARIIALGYATCKGVCPRINGTIHGLLYYSDASTCSAQALTDLTLYGSLVSETSIGREIGSPTIHQQDYTGTQPYFAGAIGAIRVAGSWRDF